MNINVAIIIIANGNVLLNPVYLNIYGIYSGIYYYYGIIIRLIYIIIINITIVDLKRLICHETTFYSPYTKW